MSGSRLLLASLLVVSASCSSPPPSRPSRPKPPPAIEQSFVKAEWLKTMLPKAIWPTWTSYSDFKTALPDVAEAGEEQKSEGFRLGYSERPYLKTRYLKLAKGPHSLVRLLVYKGQASKQSGHLGTLVTFREPLDYDAAKDELGLKLDKTKVYHRMQKGTFVFAGECQVPGKYGSAQKGFAWWRFRAGKLDGLLICAGFLEKNFRFVAFMDEGVTEAVLEDLPESLRPMTFAQLKESDRADQQRKSEAWQAYQKKKAAEREAAKTKAANEQVELGELTIKLAAAELAWDKLMKAKDFVKARALASEACAMHVRTRVIRGKAQFYSRKTYEWTLKIKLPDLLIERARMPTIPDSEAEKAIYDWRRKANNAESSAGACPYDKDLQAGFRKVAKSYRELVTVYQALCAARRARGGG